MHHLAAQTPVRARARAASATFVVALAVLFSLLVPSGAEAATVTEGTWENTSSSFHYKGSWKKVSSKRDSGGSSSVLKRKGHVEITFRAAGVSLVAPKDKSSGKADVYLDGVKKARVDLYSKKSRRKQVVFTATGLTDAEHTLKVVRTGKKAKKSRGTKIQVDAVRTFAAPTTGTPTTGTPTTSTPAPKPHPVDALPAGTYEDDSKDVVRQGSWSRTRSGSATTDSGGSFSTLSSPGSAQVTFATSGIRWIARTNAYSGTADVYLDGVKKDTVDLYSSTTKFRRTVFEVSGLSETGHTLKIVRTGDKNPASSGRAVTLDAFVAPDVYAPSAPASVTATASRTGANLTWTTSPEPDVAGYRVLRRADGSSTDVLVGTTGPRTTSFADVGLANASAYSWRVVARDTTGNDSTASAPAELRTAADPFAAHPRRYAGCPAATVTVSTRAQLLSAISAATSGTVIVLRPGSYGSDYVVRTRASASAPMWICGPRSAVLSRETGKGYGVRFDGASNVVLAGLTVREVQKGISAQRSSHLTIADLRVERIGEEAIHLKNQTTDSTVIGNSIDTTGLLTKNYGEGVYIGTAQGNWCVYNDCLPDASDRNVVAFNTIRGTTAEAIEAKAGTNDGTMWRNTMDGASISADDADSLVQVMGSGWVVAGNRGAHAPEDAIQVWNTDGGRYGLDNVVYANAVSDSLRGYVARLPFVESGNVVGCDNVAAGTALGMSNKTCQN